MTEQERRKIQEISGILDWQSTHDKLEDMAKSGAHRLEVGKRLIEALQRCLRAPGLSSLANALTCCLYCQECGGKIGWNQQGEELKALQEQVRRDCVYAFRRGFKSAAEARGWQVQRLGTEPLEFKVGPFSLCPNLQRGTAKLCYARSQVLAEMSLELDTLFDVLEEQVAVFERRGHKNGLPKGVELSSPQSQRLFCREFFQDILTAYRIMIRCRRKQMGERVPLHDIWAVLAVLRQNDQFTDTGDAAFYQEYSRAQFAWDIARLRLHGGLQQNGQRLNLSTATIGTTKNKELVFWLDDGLGNGQYYLSLWFQ